MAVAVVTDSTAYFPAGPAERRGIRQVPLHVLVDGRPWLDGVRLGPVELVAALVRRASVSTSRPTPAEFEVVYTEMIEAGADVVVSVHLSRALSGTWESGRLAAERSVDTLEHLRRGGRVSSAAARLSTALAVTPLLHVDLGRVVPLEKVRTATRARARLVGLVVQAAGSPPFDLAVHHLDVADRALELVEQLRARLPTLPECLVSEVGAAIGAHTGPGMLGVVVLPGGLQHG